MGAGRASPFPLNPGVQSAQPIEHTPVHPRAQTCTVTNLHATNRPCSALPTPRSALRHCHRRYRAAAAYCAGASARTDASRFSAAGGGGGVVFARWEFATPPTSQARAKEGLGEGEQGATLFAHIPS